MRLDSLSFNNEESLQKIQFLTGNLLKFIETDIAGIYEFKKEVFRDERGMFERLFDTSLFDPYLNGEKIVNINHSVTTDIGVVRGLHLQRAPFQEIKVIQALKGRVVDIAVDMRKDSPSFLKHILIELSPDLSNGVILPQGVAHGFQVLEGKAELLYFHTERYAKESEYGFNIKDPALGIQLPLPIKFMSEKDHSYAFINNDFEGI